MKLLFFDDYRLGVMKDERVVDVSNALGELARLEPQNLLVGVIESWTTMRPRLEEAVARESGAPFDSVVVRPPVPRPCNIVCMAINYMESGTLDERPIINAFHKSPTALIGHGETMVLPDVPATVFEGEAELAIVIGKTASSVPASDAMHHIFGYTNFIDGSARGLLPANQSFYKGKSRRTFAPVGPYIVTADEVPDPQNLAVRLWNNGVLMQDFNTNDMAHQIPECIEFVTSLHDLVPGDLLATGTNHRGLNPFMDGDRVEMEVEGLGRLAITVRDDLQRTWKRETRIQHKESGGEEAFGQQISGKYAPAPTSEKRGTP